MRQEETMPQTATALKERTTGQRPWTEQGVSLAHGTQVRIEHGGRVYHGRIEDAQWCVTDHRGREHSAETPSKAAGLVCKTISGDPAHVNGWLHWEVKIANARAWVLLDEFRPR